MTHDSSGSFPDRLSTGDMDQSGDVGCLASSSKRCFPPDQIAQVKRFYERYACDPKFRAKLADTRHLNSTGTALDIAREFGLEIDPAALAPLWHDGFKATFEPEELAGFPLLKHWNDTNKAQIESLKSRRKFEETDWTNACFGRWRQRQVNRVESELGRAGGVANRFPVIAFELSDGCSVGCWFCGVSASRYAGSFTYSSENARLWRQILAIVFEQLGNPAREGFCYWASEPLDNPDYEKFVSDYQEIIGTLPSLTTAVPLRDVARTRNLLRLRKQAGGGHDRFSILTVKLLDRIHAEFTAEELMHTECIPQTRGSSIVKTQTGKLYGRAQAADLYPGSQATENPRTIACVAGFLVNMVKGEIRLVSPCRANDSWPDGYIVHRKGSFRSAEEFHDAMRSMIDDVAGVSLNARSIIRLRVDLDLEILPDCIELKSPGARHTLTSSLHATLIAGILSRGPRRHGDIMSAVMEAGGDCFAAGKMIQDWFDRGLISDAPDDIYGVSNVGIV